MSFNSFCSSILRCAVLYYSMLYYTTTYMLYYTAYYILYCTIYSLLCYMHYTLRIYMCTFFLKAGVAVYFQLEALHWGQSHHGTAFALPRDDHLWILGSHYTTLSSLRSGMKSEVRMSPSCGFISKTRLISSILRSPLT